MPRWTSIFEFWLLVQNRTFKTPSQQNYNEYFSHSKVFKRPLINQAIEEMISCSCVKATLAMTST